jgi:hypothetical protein
MLTVSWFTLSTGLALFNKQVFGRRHGGFPAPLFLTSVGLCTRLFQFPHRLMAASMVATGEEVAK